MCRMFRSPKRLLGLICLFAWLATAWLCLVPPKPKHTDIRLAGDPGSLHQLSPDGSILATWSIGYTPNSTLQLWDTASGMIRSQMRIMRKIGQVVLSPDSRNLAVFGPNLDDDLVTVIDIATCQERLTVQHGLGLVRERGYVFTDFSPDGKILVTEGGGSYGFENVNLWDLATGREIAFFHNLETDAPLWAQVDWRTGQRRESRLPQTPSRLRYSVWAAHGETLAMAGHDGKIYLQDFTTQGTVAHGRLGDDVDALAFSPDGKTLAVRFFKPSAMKDGMEKLSSKLGVQCPDWLLPQSSYVALLDVETRKPLALLPTFTATRMAFRPDGRTLVVYADDEDLLQLWDVPPRSRFSGLSGWLALFAFLGTLAWLSSYRNLYAKKYSSGGKVRARPDN